MRVVSKLTFAALGIAFIAVSASIVLSVSQKVDRPFSGFLLLENGVVASAGLMGWPATRDGEIFQKTIVSYDGIAYQTPALFYDYIESRAVGTVVEYEFSRTDSNLNTSISTRLFTPSDAGMLFGASLVCALTFIGVAGALRYIAPNDPASLGSTISFLITGLFALTALDLYGPYRFFRVHAVAECFLGAGMFHMALVFPYQRSVVRRFPTLIPLAYGGSVALGIVTALFLDNPAIYVQTHRIAIAAAGASFLVMIISQLSAYLRPTSYAARQRVTILAMGTFASIMPAFSVLIFSTYSGGGATENLIGWAGAFFPISVAYAVLKADALQVDAILRRTVSYVLLTIAVAASYAAIIGGIEWLFRDRADAPRWISILAFSSFCTFGVLPLRNIMQSWVDRIFFRSVYDFRLTIEETSKILARLIHLGSIQERIKDAVFEALHPESVDFFVYDENIVATAKHQPPIPTDGAIVDTSSGGIAIPFQSHHRIVALLVLGRRLSGRFYSGEDRALLQVLSNQGAIAIENALALERLRDLNRTLETRVDSRTSELATTIHELRQTQAQLIQAERLAAVGELAAGVAHEVNNPLNFARNSLRALNVMVDELSDCARAMGRIDLDDANGLDEQLRSLTECFREKNPSELADDVKQLVEILGSGLDRTASLVSDLRDFASTNSRDRSPFNLAETVRSTFMLTASVLKSSLIEVRLDVADDVGLAFGDQSSMSQVILNVIKNSADALRDRERGSICASIKTSSNANMLRLTISDDGPGIDSKVAERVFEPFFTTKKAGKGTGLGLAMCRRTMQECGGEIWISAHDDSGTRVEIEVPIWTGEDTSPR